MVRFGTRWDEVRIFKRYRIVQHYRAGNILPLGEPFMKNWHRKTDLADVKVSCTLRHSLNRAFTQRNSCRLQLGEEPDCLAREREGGGL